MPERKLSDTTISGTPRSAWRMIGRARKHVGAGLGIDIVDWQLPAAFIGTSWRSTAKRRSGLSAAGS